MANQPLHIRIYDELGDDKSLIGAYLLGRKHALEELEARKIENFLKSSLFIIGYLILGVALYYTRERQAWQFLLTTTFICLIFFASGFIAFKLKSKEGFGLSFLLGLICLFGGRGDLDYSKEGKFFSSWAHDKLGIKSDTIKIMTDTIAFYRNAYLRIDDSLKQEKIKAINKQLLSEQQQKATLRLQNRNTHRTHQ